MNTDAIVIKNSLHDMNPSGPSDNGADDDDDDLLGGGGGAGLGASLGAFNPYGNKDFDVKKNLLLNYNKKFQNADPALFRDETIRQTLSCLIGMTKPNALLIGPAGTGKTKIVEEIARRIANQDPSIPDQLLDYTIYELPISSIIAGSSLVGEVEKKAQAVIKFATEPKNKVILFMDEVHMLCDSHDSSYSKVAQILKPALARGDMKCIGATTTQEAKSLYNDPAFNRRFTRLVVDELTQEQTKVILQNMTAKFFNHYKNKITIDDDVINNVIAIADANKTMTSHRPDNAITLLDRSLADMYIDLKHMEGELHEKDEIARKNGNVNTHLVHDFLQTLPRKLATSQMKKTAIRILTGNNKKSVATYEQLVEAFKAVKGQDDIIESLINEIERDNLQIFPRVKPLSFLFAGSSGVGKSEVAKCLAKVLTNLKPITINMAEFDSNMSITRLIGSPAGYVGSDSKKELPFDILETNPYQVILLDEFEKADEQVQQLFMSALDEGYIKDSNNKYIDFSRSIIIATTNAGYDADTRSLSLIQDGTENDASADKLAEDIKPEIINRFTKMFTFHPISKTMFGVILMDKYITNVTRIKGINRTFDYLPDILDKEALAKMIKDNYQPLLGARHTYDIVKGHIEDLIIAHDKQAATLVANTPANDDKPFSLIEDDDDVLAEYLAEQAQANAEGGTDDAATDNTEADE